MQGVATEVPPTAWICPWNSSRVGVPMTEALKDTSGTFRILPVGKPAAFCQEGLGQHVETPPPPANRYWSLGVLPLSFQAASGT